MGYHDLSQEYYTRWVSKSEDGISDDNLVLAHQLMQKAGYEPVVFFDRDTPMSRIEFIQWARCEYKLMFMQFRRDGTPLSLFWMQDFSPTGRQAYAHFTTLNTATVDECVISGKQIIQFAGKLTTVRQLIGITPVCYRHALNFAYRLGFKKLAILEKIAMIRGKERDAVLSVCSTYGE